MAVDDSFKKPGAVPFKWEIRPGVPKLQQSLPQKPKQQKPTPKQPPPPLPPPASPFINLRSSPNLPGRLCPRQKLKPPPAGSYLQQQTKEPRSHSFRSTPRSRSEPWRFDQPTRVQPENVSPGCFPSSLLRRKGTKRRNQKPEPDSVSDVETLSRWSVSSRKSLSPFYGSPASSFSSFRSSPRPVADAEWAGFGLF